MSSNLFPTTCFLNNRLSNYNIGRGSKVASYLIDVTIVNVV